jgi:DNA invertase Pin-like site-specific DNA recombinase
MESIIIAPEERKDFILWMKREQRPSRRLRMHIVLLAADGRSPSEIARTLFCSRTTVYAIVGRFSSGRVKQPSMIECCGVLCHW